MESFEEHIKLAIDFLVAAKVDIEEAAKHSPSNATHSDLWDVYHTIDEQMRKLVMAGREHGIDIPVYWLKPVN